MIGQSYVMVGLTRASLDGRKLVDETWRRSLRSFGMRVLLFGVLVVSYIVGCGRR